MSNINKSKSTRVTGSAGVAQRLRIRERDNYTCCRCTRITNTGEVDHTIPLDEYGTNEDSNLKYLCIDCHKIKTAEDRNYTIKSGSTDTGLPIDLNHHWNT